MKEASKVTLLIPLVKEKKKEHYQGREETHRRTQTHKMFPLIHTRYKQISLFKQDALYVALCGNTDLLFQHLIDIHLQARVSQGPSCHQLLNAYVHSLNEDSIGQLIEQHPGRGRRGARRNSAQWCHLVPPRADPARALE